MKLYEYMGKELFAKHGIPVPYGRVARNPADARKVAEEIGSVIIKSQVLSGKRGKAGGIKFANTGAEAHQMAADLLRTELCGYRVEAVLVEEKLKIDRELYLAIALDGAARRPVVLASADGGMDIEEVPEDRIVKVLVDVAFGLQPYTGREIARRLGLTGALAKQFTDILVKMYKMFVEQDAELVEINPLVLSSDGLIAADAKITIDDESLYRHKDLPLVLDQTRAEMEAREIGLAYVELDGDIAVMANGAGMAMATLDILQYFGGKPANFLDAGGGANIEQTAKALEILLSAKPSAIFINIFGGITRCDDVARAFVQVKQANEIPVPVVIRIVGTNEQEGVRILTEAGIKAYKLMHEAAAEVVRLAKAARSK